MPSFDSFEATRAMFANSARVTNTQLREAVIATHQNLFGDIGYGSFLNLLDRTQQLYTNNAGTATNSRKAGLHMMGMLEAAADLRISAVEPFFDSKIPGEYIAEVYSERPATLSLVLNGVARAISSRREEHGKNYRGVVAAIVSGSYANGTFLPKTSDIDTVLVMETAESGMGYGDQWLDYESDAKRAIATQTKRPVDVSLPVPLSESQRIIDLARQPDSIQYNADLLVVSPDGEIAERVAHLLRTGRQDLQQTAGIAVWPYGQA